MTETKLNIDIDSSWLNILDVEFQSDYFKMLVDFLQQEKKSGKVIFPPEREIFTAYNLTPFDKVKVVIIGQDPYHGLGQAHGLSFSVKDGIKHPPSLRNMFKELMTDIDGFETPESGNLTKWGEQGVLMLNAILTVEAKKAASHHKQGWENFTDATIKKISEKLENVVFILWGKYAQSKACFIDDSKHLVLEAAHPSPFSAHNGFFGCKHFSKANEYLKEKDRGELDWKLNNATSNNNLTLNLDF